jgi:hypothetical protein
MFYNSQALKDKYQGIPDFFPAFPSKYLYEETLKKKEK